MLLLNKCVGSIFREKKHFNETFGTQQKKGLTSEIALSKSTTEDPHFEQYCFAVLVKYEHVA